MEVRLYERVNDDEPACMSAPPGYAYGFTYMVRLRWFIVHATCVELRLPVTCERATFGVWSYVGATRKWMSVPAADFAEVLWK